MKKCFKYIVALTAILMVMPLQAQKPDIIDRDPDIARITENDIPYSWRNNDYFVSGTYHDTLRVEDDNIPDTAFTLILMVKEYLRLPQEQITLNASQSTYLWRGRELPVTNRATYQDTATAIDFIEPDTIHSLRMTVYAEGSKETVYLYPTTKDYLWLGKLRSVKDTTYLDTITAAVATEPDTICSLTMFVKKYFNYATTFATICQTQTPYFWRGKKYYETDFHSDTVHTQIFTDKDTVYTLNLTVGVPFQQSVYYKLCPGDTVRYRGRIYAKEGTDTIRLSSFSGCDSLYIVRVEVGASNLNTTEEHICAGDTFVWAKSTGEVVLTQPGYYFDSLQNTDGCDSIICLHLSVIEPYFRKDTLAVCEHELPYQFGKQWLNESGTYYDTVQYDREQCLSIIQLNFTVLKNTYEEKTIQFCQGTGVRHNNGEIFYDARVYTDTVPSHDDGCYHIIRTVYTPGPVYKMEEWRHRSTDELTYLWHGITCTKDGVYTDRHNNTEGCDSTWILHLVTDYHTFLDSTVCSGDTMYYKNIQIAHDTTVIDSLISTFGGDSLLHIHFTFPPRYYFWEKTTICSNEYLPWPGHEDIILHEPGSYFDRYTSHLGCDSIYEMNVTVNKVYSQDTLVAVSGYYAVDSLPYIWYDGHNNRHELYNDTVIVDTLGHTPPKYLEDHKEGDIWYRSLSGGCDSTTSIHFYVIRKYSFDTIPLCPNGKVIVDGHTYTETGDYQHRLLATPWSTFRDSIHYFTIVDATIYNNDVWDADTICQSQLPYRWYHRVCMRTGEYTDTIPSYYGCDSIVYLKLLVKPAYNIYIQKTICAGDSFYINGRHITKSGIYVDSLTTHLGCDSIYNIVVNVARSYHFNQTDYFNQGSVYPWHRNGQPWLLTQPGVYFDSCQTVANGCDSIYQLTLVEDKSYHFYDTLRICANDLPCRWRNQVIYQSGDYKDELSTKRGMDSIYSLNLTVYPKYFEERSVQICPSEQLVISGKAIFQSGTYTDSLLTINGCDSVTEYHVSMVPGFFMDEVIHMGPKTSVSWHQRTFTQPGVYYDSLKTTNGCDSVFRLSLIADPTYYFYDTVRICQSEVPLKWHGNSYYASGDYVHPYLSQFQMDSIHHLNLTIDPKYEITQNVNRCQGDHFFINQQWINKAGIFYDTLNTVLGCDSVVRTIVNFHPTFYERDTMHLINGTSVQWHGQTISEMGTYFDSAHSVFGCDSIYQLTILLADTFSLSENVIVCEEDLPYMWHGQAITQSGHYSDIHTSTHHADSSYYLNLMVAPKYEQVQNATLCHGGTISYFGKTISQPGEYKDTLLSAFGCDSVLILRVNWKAEKHSEQTIHLCHGQSFSINGQVYTKSGSYTDTVRTEDGCDSICHYFVQIAPQYLTEETKSINPGTSYVWVGHKGDIELTKAGVYKDTLQAVGGCDSIFVLTLTVNTAYQITKELHICQNEVPYFWRGQYLVKSGTYYDSLQTKQLTDSIYCLILHVNDTTIQDRQYDFCTGEIVQIGNHSYKNSTYFYDTIFSEYGCPQIVRHVLRFHPTYQIAKTIHLDDGGSYQFFDILITKPGVYSHTEPTIFGCDSTITLTVNFCKPKTATDMKLRLCIGDTMQIGDTIITSPGIYERVYPGKYGCDSTVRYIVQAYNTYHWTSYASFCQNESYKWEGHLNDTVINKPGKYEEHFKTIDGCDSVYTLILRALPAYMHDTIIYKCQDEVPYIHNGKAYYTNQEFRDTMRSQGGCDSIATTRYILHNRCSNWDLYTRCQGDELVVDFRNIEKDGEYRFQIGTDSVHRFNVLSYKTYDYSVSLGSYCDSVTYRGETYYARGKGKETFTVDRFLKTIHECDSIEHVTMTLYQSAPVLQHTQIIYDYASVLFGGQLYNKTGTYTHTYHTIHGCDSTSILHLQVIPTDSTGALRYRYCYSSHDNLEIFGKFYHPTKDTIIYDTITIPDVSMWVIKKAIVQVTYPFTITSVQAENEVCSSNPLSFNIEYGYHGSFPARYELDFLPSELSVSPTHQEGEINNKTTINVSMSGRGVCVAPGVYPYRLKLMAEDCHMSDTIVESTIVVHYPSSIMEANWDNVVALVNKDNNEGKWQFLPPYNWQIWNESGQDKTALIAPDPSLSYLYTDYLESGDRIVVTTMREGYKKLVSSCEYIFYPVATDNNIPILVYPTAVRKTAHMTIEAPVDGTYHLYNHAGQKIQTGTFINGKQDIAVPAIEGCYILQLQPQNNGQQIKKIMVY